MEPIELKKDEIEKNGTLLVPKLKDHNSLYFHPLTKIYDSSHYPTWGYLLYLFCKKGNIQYYFLKNKNRKINVYPNSALEEWFKINEQRFSNAKKCTVLR